MTFRIDTMVRLLALGSLRSVLGLAGGALSRSLAGTMDGPWGGEFVYF